MLLSSDDLLRHDDRHEGRDLKYPELGVRRQKALRLMMFALTNKTHFYPGKRLEDV